MANSLSLYSLEISVLLPRKCYHLYGNGMRTKESSKCEQSNVSSKCDAISTEVKIDTRRKTLFLWCSSILKRQFKFNITFYAFCSKLSYWQCHFQMFRLRQWKRRWHCCIGAFGVYRKLAADIANHVTLRRIVNFPALPPIDQKCTYTDLLSEKNRRLSIFNCLAAKQYKQNYQTLSANRLSYRLYNALRCLTQ